MHPGSPRADCPTHLNLKIKPNTIRARPRGLGKHRRKVLGLGRARPMGLGLVFGV